jgi:glucose-1-phosphate thymidylyltransferase
VGNRALVCHAFDSLDKAGVSDVALVMHPDRERGIREAISTGSRESPRILLTGGDDADGLVGALTYARPFIGNAPFVVHLGDSLAGDGIAPCLDEFARDNLDALILVHEAGNGDGVVRLASGRLQRLAERGGHAVAPAGVYLFGPRALEVLSEVDPDASGELGVAAIVERLLDTGGSVGTHCVESWWRYRDGPQALIEANQLALEAMTPCPDSARVPPDSRVEGPVIIDPSAEIKASAVRGPAVIGPRARLDHCYIGPYTSVGPDVIVEGSEIENSVVLAGATIAHVSARIESSVIGSRARVHRPFKLPSAMRLCLGEGAEVSLV